MLDVIQCEPRFLYARIILEFRTKTATVREKLRTGDGGKGQSALGRGPAEHALDERHETDLLPEECKVFLQDGLRMA